MMRTLPTALLLRRGPILLAALGLLALSGAPAVALDVEVGAWIEVKATHPEGVPLHREPRPSLMGRASDGARGQVVDTTSDAHWIRLHLEDGRAGWIVERYVAREVEPPSIAPDPAEERTVWSSPGGCRQVVVTGRRAAPTRADVLRIATWNVRWFADETDIEWLACTIAWLNVDVLAVSEIRDTADARVAMDRVLLMLGSFTQARWAVDLHECGPAHAQHVGFLWNTDRVAVSDQHDLWLFNARATADGSPCRGSLRPGRYAYVAGKDGGVDFHAVAVHLKSGATAPARAERLTVLDRLDALRDTLPRVDDDLVVLGDFNTMGVGMAGSAGAEIDGLFTTAATEAPGYLRLSVAPSCTEYYRGRPHWLDHVLVSRLMAESRTATARVSGYCAVKGCSPIGGEKPAAYRALSDHCPLVLEVRNQDRD